MNKLHTQWEYFRDTDIKTYSVLDLVVGLHLNQICVTEEREEECRQHGQVHFFSLIFLI
jgi:hypothetical protein